jgi:hypothetical protein
VSLDDIASERPRVRYGKNVVAAEIESRRRQEGGPPE